MKDVLASYRPGVAFDEMIDESGEVRPSYQAVFRSLERATKDELKVIAEFLANNYFQAGVTFDVGGVERPFPLDLVPRVIASAEWETIESGVAQRVKALEAFLADVYSDAKVISDGVIPRQLVTSSTHYHRAVWGIEPPNGVRVHVAGVDLVRTPAGRRTRAGGQRPGAERRLVRDDEPDRDADRDAGRIQQPADPSGRQLSAAAADRRCGTPRRRGSTTRTSSC